MEISKLITSRVYPFSVQYLMLYIFFVYSNMKTQKYIWFSLLIVFDNAYIIPFKPFTFDVLIMSCVLLCVWWKYYLFGWRRARSNLTLKIRNEVFFKCYCRNKTRFCIDVIAYRHQSSIRQQYLICKNNIHINLRAFSMALDSFRYWYMFNDI